MTSQTKQKMLTKQTKLRSIHFNRFLLFRYITAIFFFFNLYWSIFSVAQLKSAIIIPLALILVDLGIIYEQTKKYWEPSNDLRMTKIGYCIQLSVNLLGLVLLISGYHGAMFPFINGNGRLVLGSVLLIGVILCLLVVRRIGKISKDEDSYFKHMKVFEKNVNREG